MSKGFVNGKNWLEDLKAQNYWAFPSSYSQEKKEQEIANILGSNAYIATEKKDGYWEAVIVDEDGDFFMRSRNKGVNGVVEKSGHVPHLHDFFNLLPNNTILVGEVHLPNGTSKNITSILGCGQEKAIARQEKGEKLHYYIFDVLFWDGEEVHKLGAKDRLDMLQDKLTALRAENDKAFDYITIADYKQGEDIHNYWLNILDDDGEGIVLTLKDYPYSFGKRTARKTLKLKKELAESIDVFLTGHYKQATYLYTGKELENWQYWYNPITKNRYEGDYFMRSEIDNLEPVTKPWFFGWAGSIEIGMIKDGQEIPVGWISNITDEVKEGIVTDNDEYKHKVIELQAMEIQRDTDIPTLRHAKIVQWRDDKDYTECDWSQLL